MKYIKEKDYFYDLTAWVLIMAFGVWKGGLVFSIVSTVLLLMVVALKMFITRERNSNEENEGSK